MLKNVSKLTKYLINTCYVFIYLKVKAISNDSRKKSRISCVKCWKKKRNWIDIFPSDGNSARKKNMNNNSWLVTFFSVVYLAEFMAAFWFENLLVMLSFQHNGTKNRLVHTKHFPLFKHVSIFIPLDIWSVNWVHNSTYTRYSCDNGKTADKRNITG